MLWRVVEAVLFSYGLSVEFETVSVVHEAIADRIGDGFVADEGVPLSGVKLTGDDGGALSVAIFEDFAQIAAFDGFKRGIAEVIDDEDMGFCQFLEKPRIRAVGFGLVEITKEARGAGVVDLITLAACFVAEGTREVGFPDAGGAGDNEVLVRGDPTAADELKHFLLLESTGMLVVNFLDGGGHGKVSISEALAETAVLAVYPFGIGKKSDEL